MAADLALRDVLALSPTGTDSFVDTLSEEQAAALEREWFGTTGLSLLTWTEQYRRIGETPLTPSALPWLRDLYAIDPTTTPEAWVMKASQVFISEWMVSAALWVAETRFGGRGNALYVFPTERQMQDFVHARVDTAVEASEYLRKRVGATKARGEVRAGVDNVGLKRIGPGWVYFRGSEQRRQIISVDADAVLFDEVDEFAEGTVDVARKRLNSARQPLIRGGSTPKFPASGIAAIWDDTTKRRYFLTCSACGTRQALKFPENLQPDGTLVCASCQRPGVDIAQEGEWVAEAPEAAVEGYHINRLYSPRADLKALAKLGYSILGGLVSDPTKVQEFHNQDLGVPHAPAGGAVTEDVLAACTRDYGHPTTDTTGGPVVMGVDVGNTLNIIIRAPVPEGPSAQHSRLLYAGTTQDWAELGRLIHRFGVHFTVIDAHPLDHQAKVFADEFPGRVFRCFYPNMTAWRHDDLCEWNHRERTVVAHRTRLLDALFDRFYRQEEWLPREAATIPGLYLQLKAPVRVLVENADGQLLGKYQEGSAADHYAHAYAYSYLAWKYALPQWQRSGNRTASYSVGGDPAPTVQRQAVLRLRGAHGTPGGSVNPFAEKREDDPEKVLAAAIAQSVASLNGQASGVLNGKA